MSWSLPVNVLVVVGCAAVIAVAGSALTRLADRLADRTGLGEALFGVIFLGASTSLPEIATTITAAAGGAAGLAYGNAVGGVAIQTVMLSVADIAYRRVNLEHAAASVPNLMNGTLLVSLLAALIFASTVPGIAFFGVHPASPLVLIWYVYGLRLIRSAQDEPMWLPKRTADTRLDVPDHQAARELPLASMWWRFALFAALVGAAGWAVAVASEGLSVQLGISQTTVGLVLTAFVTSLPELVTSVAAVRQGAVTMAVAGVIGGNAFDTLLVAVADIAYRPGPIFAAVDNPGALLTLPLVLTSVLLLGLLRRERHGPGNVGFETVLILVLYGVGLVTLTR